LASSTKNVTVIGAGLAGCEAALQLARRGVNVRLIEMKPLKRGPAHSCDNLAELVCSNSLRSDRFSSAAGLLKAEMRRCGSALMAAADACAVPAGRALAVDRLRFSEAVEAAIGAQPNISLERGYAQSLPDERTILATGPLTDGGLACALAQAGAMLAYHDAIAPLVSADSIDMTRAYFATRYDQEDGTGGDYLNCPLTEEDYNALVDALVEGEKSPLHDFETAPFFEGCLPIEEMARRGPRTLKFGPLKPVGLTDPSTGRWPHAVVQLRREDEAGTAYNLVGFQTRLVRSAQDRVIRLIPALRNAHIERYGQVHRNSFVNAPVVLDDHLRLVSLPRISLAGQLTGSEGYIEAIATGLLSALFVAAELGGKNLEPPPRTTALGGLHGHLRKLTKSYQPSNIVWAMLEYEPRKRAQSKKEHRQLLGDKALKDLEDWWANVPGI
jgi:methylenetetrahydrofolate--tRNA-(uracil-5-)-methyltransferase